MEDYIRLNDVLIIVYDSSTVIAAPYLKVQNPTGITPDGVIYIQLVTPEFGTELFKRVVNDFYYLDWFYEDGDGEDWSLAFNRFLATGFTNLRLTPYKRYKLVSTITLIDNDSLVIEGVNSELYADTTFSITFRKLRAISGIKFNLVRLSVFYLYDGTETTISRNEFSGATSGSIYASTGSGQWARNLIIEDNIFNGHNYGIYGAFSRCIIRRNRFVNTLSRNIEIWAGEYNEIYSNTISGGVTGITFLTRRNLTSNVGNGFNKIHHNFIENISEEGISLDLRGNNAAETGSVIRGTVTSAASNPNGIQFTSDIDLNEGAAYRYTGMYVCFISGVYKGELRRIIYMGPTGREYIQVDETTGGISPGDLFVICVPSRYNEITSNTVVNTISPIHLWGLAFNTIVKNNTIQNTQTSQQSAGGIRVASLEGMLGGYYAPCFNNLIEGNKLYRCGLRIDMQVYPIGSSPSYQSVGNTVLNNDVSGSACAYDQQEYWEWNNNRLKNSNLSRVNSGTSLPSPNSSLSGTIMIKIEFGEDIPYICLYNGSIYEWRQF